MVNWFRILRHNKNPPQITNYRKHPKVLSVIRNECEFKWGSSCRGCLRIDPIMQGQFIWLDRGESTQSRMVICLCACVLWRVIISICSTLRAIHFDIKFVTVVALAIWIERNSWFSIETLDRLRQVVPRANRADCRGSAPTNVVFMSQFVWNGVHLICLSFIGFPNNPIIRTCKCCLAFNRKI